MANMLSNLDFHKNQALNLVIHQTAVDPSGGALTEGLFWYNTVSHLLKYYDGTTVQILASGSGLTQEQIEDYVGGMVSSNTETGITVTYDDPGGKLNFVVTDSPLLGGNTSAFHLARANHTGTQAFTTVTTTNTDVLLGRDTAAGGAAEEITVTGGLEFTGSSGIQRSALTGDITASAGSNTTAIAAGVIVNADVSASAGIVVTKLAASTTDVLFGRDTAAAGAGEEISVSGGLEFTGTAGIQRSALTGDITATAGSNTTAIAAGVIVNADVNAAAAIAYGKLALTGAILNADLAGSIAYSKLNLTGAILNADLAGSIAYGKLTLTGSIVNADVAAAAGIVVTKLASSATDRLFGRDTAAAGAGEEITVGGGIEFTGSAGIQRSALTGDITASAGSGTTAIAAGVIVDADVNASAGIVVTKLASSATDRLFGRDTASAGAGEEITVGGGLEFTGSAGIQRSALTGDITATAGSGTTAIAAGVIVDADVNASAAIAATKLAFTPTGNIAATTVQAAIAEVETDYIAAIALAIEGRTWKDPVDAALTTALPNTPTYSSGAGTLTAGANAAFPTVDGVAAASGNRYLIVGQASTFQNGLYSLTTVGSGAAAWVLTRTVDANTAAELTDATVVIDGDPGTSTLGGDIYTQVNTLADLTSAAQSWVKTGNTNTVYTSDGTTITLTGNSFSITSAGVTETHLATSVAGGGLVGGAGTPLAVGAGTSITVNANDIAVTAAGITATQLAASVAGGGLTGGAGTALAVGAGNGITVNADDVALATSTAGAGLTYTTGVLAVGAGTGITVNADDIAITAAGITATQLAASVAGNGLVGGAGTALAVGAGTGIISNANDVAIDTAVVVSKYAVAFGDGVATSYVITHSLGTRDVIVGIYLASGTYEEVMCDVEHTSTSTVTLRFAVAPTTNQYRVVIHA